MKKAIVIGSGIAGLASSIRLKAKGYQVDVFEQAEKAGGKMGELKTKGYRWDTGPSLFTMPQLVDELFTLLGENPRDSFNYISKKTVCHYFWEDGTSFQAKTKLSEFTQEAAETFQEPEHQLKKYLTNSKLKYELTAPLFLNHSLHKAATYFSPSTLKALSSLPKLNLNSTLNEVNSSYFKNPKLIQLFNRYATYNGSSPYQTPGIMSMIPSLEMQQGTFFPEGGMRSIAESLFKLAQRHGVQFHFNETAKELVVSNKKIVCLKTNKGSYEADEYVCNMDVFFAYQKLMPKVKAPQKTLEQERSSSGIIFYWGIKGVFDQLGLHNIFFSEDYKREFQEIFKQKKVPFDPTVYINITSKEKADDAPKGCENWFVMINVPATNDKEWKERVKVARKRVVEKLGRILNVEIENLIKTEDVLEPSLIEKKTYSHLGALYGTASNSKYSAFLRHPNFSKQLDNLWFCGGSVHPGGGIPLCLKSAKIATQLIS
ncbi:MAG: 1-hydroxycarotenoid 3,4-desaturase CrtD [Vicingaceae bacterium]